ncbi:MAG: hypothetical protein D6711_19160, partial [Chloroflexi bacterium]
KEDIKKALEYLQALPGTHIDVGTTPAEAEETPTEVDDTPTEAALRAALTAFGKRNNMRPRAFLQEAYGVERLSDLPTHLWADCYRRVSE